MFVFAGVRGVGLTLGAGVGDTGTVQSIIPLGCGTQFGSFMNGLFPRGTWITLPPGPIGGPPGGGLLPLSHGLPASPGTAPDGTIVFVFASYENSGGRLDRSCSSTPVAGFIGCTGIPFAPGWRAVVGSVRREYVR